jgi:hypothetical protein
VRASFLSLCNFIFLWLCQRNTALTGENNGILEDFGLKAGKYKKNFYVDQYSPEFFLTLVSILILGVLDAILKISDHQQRCPRPLPGAILIRPALLMVADSIIIESWGL